MPWSTGTGTRLMPLGRIGILACLTQLKSGQVTEGQRCESDQNEVKAI
jgi:hypothetical protein